MGESPAWRAGPIVAVLVLLLALSLSACGSDESQSNPRAEAAMVRYQRYLERNSTRLVTWATQLSDQVAAGRVTFAKSRYASSRVPYGRIELVAETFEDLDPRINALPGDVPGQELGGYHQLERALWKGAGDNGTRATAKELLADVEELQGRVTAARLSPGQLAHSTTRQLNEVLAREIVGLEEPYARIDLIDTAANVEGAKAAFRAIEPRLTEADPDLAGEIEASFRDAFDELSGFGVGAWEPSLSRPGAPGTSFVLYMERSDAEYRRLGQRIRAVAELLAQVPDQVGETWSRVK